MRPESRVGGTPSQKPGMGMTTPGCKSSRGCGGTTTGAGEDSECQGHEGARTRPGEGEMEPPWREDVP